MLLKQSLNKLQNLKGATIEEILSKFNSNIKEFKINKGGIGQMLLLYLGLPLDSKLTDFEDGELKTNKTDENGKSKESIFITQISTLIDELICETPKDFYSSNLFKKIKNVVMLGVCKDNTDPNKWFFTYYYNFSYEKNKKLYEQFESDYNSICIQLKAHILNSNDGFIGTSNGNHIQIRTKDTKPYHPIYSKLMKKKISNKNYAFYFKAKFTKHLKRL
jgi:DNA mismatch repair protein MutH